VTLRHATRWIKGAQMIRGIKWTKFDMGFMDITNWVATHGMINGDKVIKDIMMMILKIFILAQC
jgi:hypothetical protein